MTYGDGTPLLVDPTGRNGAKTTPLTLTMINDPSNPFYATPDPISGRITNNTLITALTAIDPVHGTGATGVAGLPISQFQYNFRSPFPDGNAILYKAGDKNTGFYQFMFNFQSNYTFREGLLKGVSVFLLISRRMRKVAPIM